MGTGRASCFPPELPTLAGAGPEIDVTAKAAALPVAPTAGEEDT